MISRGSLLTCSGALLMAALLVPEASALTITNYDPGWPASASFQTGTSSDVQQGNGISNPGRVFAGQTFTVASTIQVSDIFIHLRPQAGNQSSQYQLRIYEISSDPNSTPSPTLGTVVYDSGVFAMDLATVGFIPMAAADRVFQFSLSSGEQFTLGPRPPGTGYALQFEGVSGSGFQYGYSIGSDFYAGGYVYFSSGYEGALDSPIAFLAAPTACTWNPGGAGPDNWTNPNKWNGCSAGTGPGPGPVGTPGLPDTAIVGSGSVNLDVPVAIDELQFTGGSIHGPSDLTINGNLIWSGGTFDGSGGMSPTQLTLGVGATADWSGGLKILQERRFLNLGTVTWVGGDVQLSLSAEIENQGVFGVDAQGGIRGAAELLRMTTDGSPATRLHNASTPGARIDKLGGGVLELVPGLQFDNGNAVNVIDGVMSVRGPGGDFGTYTVSLGGEIHFGPPVGVQRDLTAATVATGSGSLHKFDEGTLRVLGAYQLTGQTEVVNGQLYFDTPSDPLVFSQLRVQSPGVLTGMDNFEVTGSLSWFGGEISGATVGLGLTLTGAATGLVQLDAGRPNATLNTRDLSNLGTFTISASGNAATLFGIAAADIDNQGNFQLANNNDQNLVLDCLSTNCGTFSNLSGANVVLTSTASGVVVIGEDFTSFNNDGLVELTEGCAAISAPGTDSGTYRYAGSCTLFLSPRPDADRTLESSVVLDQLGATSLQVGGTLNINGTDRQFGNLILDPLGVLQGPADFTFNQNFIWRGEVVGTLNSQTMTIASGAVVTTSSNPADTPVLATRAISNDGQLNISEVRLQLFGNADIRNLGIVRLLGTPLAAGAIGCGDLPPNCGVLSNLAGGLVESASPPGGPMPHIETDVDFDNQGTLHVLSGVLQLNANYTAIGSSTIDIGPGAGLRRTANALNLATGTLRGSGVLDADLDVDAVSVEPGGVTTGNLGVLGDFSATSNTSFQMQVAGSAPPSPPAIGAAGPRGGGGSYDRLTISGSASLAGTLDVIDLAYTPSPPDVFDLLVYSSQTGALTGGLNPYSGLGFTLQTQATRVRLAQPGAGNTCTWNPAGAGLDNWTNPNKWINCSTGVGPGPGPVGTPGAPDTAVVGVGSTVNLDVPVTVTGLQLTGGVIQGPSDLSISNSLVWTGGRFVGTSLQSVTVQLAATADFSGGQRTLDGRTFVLNGIATWTTGLIELANGATFRVGSTGQLNSNPSLALESFFGSGTGTSSIDNDGAIIKLGANTSGISSNLEYGGSGLINVLNGTFIVAAPSPASLDSAYTVASVGILQFVGGNRSFGSSANLGGAGTLIFGDAGPQVSVNSISGCIADNSNVVIRHAEVDIDCASPTLLRTLVLNDPAAVLEGNSSIEVNFDLVWGHGLVRGAGAGQFFKLLAGATGSFPEVVGPSVPRTLQARSFVNHGSINWSGANRVVLNDGAIFNNETDGTLTIGGDLSPRGVDSNLVGGPQFLNRGALDVVGGSPVDVLASFANSGLATVTQGELNLNRAGSTDTGSYVLALAGRLGIGNGARTLAVSSSVSGSGGVDVVAGGSLLVQGGFTPGEVYVDNSSTIAFNTVGATNLQSLWLDGGTLTGSSAVNVAGTMLWEGGSVVGTGGSPGPLVIQPGATLNMDAPTRLLDGRVLRIEGSAFWYGAQLRVPQGASAKVEVVSGGLLSLDTVKSVALYGCVASPCTNLFELAGQLVQKGDGGSFLLSANLLMNGGSITSNTGNMQISPGVDVASGVVQINSPRLLTTNLVLSGGFLRGTGTVVGNVVNTGGHVQPGLSPGNLTINGDYTQGAGGFLDIEVAGTTPGSNADHLTVTGIVSLDGTLNVTSNGYTLTNPDVLEILSATGGVSGTFASATIAHPGYSENYGATTVTLQPTAVAPPVVTQISPAFGPFVGGGTLTITGNNFVIGATSFTVGPAPATVVNCTSATQCTATIPPGAGTVSVRATTASGTSVDTLADDYSYRGAPPTTCSTFSPPGSVAAGSGPVSALTADFDFNGNADVAIVNGTGNNVFVRLGNGDGTFGPPNSFGVQNSPNGAAVADFNGDGFLDLAVANRFGASVSVIPGTGAGTFGTATHFPVGTRPRAVAVGDFNEDGDADLAVADEVDNVIWLMVGNGTGGFTLTQNYATGALPNMVAIGDFNRDGHADLATPNRSSSNLSILLGNGDGTFAPASNILAGTAPFWIAVADFDGDGDGDLAVANNGSSNVSVLIGAGNGSFGAPTNFPVGFSPRSVVAADFNGDGFVDAATANSSTNDVSVLLGTGSGALGSARSFATGTDPNAIAAGDFNNDGRSDLATPNFAVDNLSILLNAGCPPAVTSINPNSGTGAGGTVVTLTGTDFVPGFTSVNFGSNPASGVSCASPVQCTATSPAGTGVVDVLVSTPDGASANTAADDYTYIPVNVNTTTTITGVTPSSVVTGQAYTVAVQVIENIDFVSLAQGVVEVRQLNDGATCTINLASASSCSLSSAVAVNTAVRARFLGDAEYLPSQSALQSVSVSRADTVITIVADTPDPSPVGTPVAVRVTLGAVAPGAGTPTGQILVTDGVASCSVQLPNLECTLNAKASGQVNIEARYLGDANYNASLDTEPHNFSSDGADLSIVKRNGLRLVPGGQPSTYVLMVGNAGPQAVVNARVTDVLPAQFSNASWTCCRPPLPPVGNDCPVSGNGNLDALLSIAANASMTCYLTATAQASPEQLVTNTATVTAPANAPDPNLGNNTSTDIDLIGVFGEGFETENE